MGRNIEMRKLFLGILLNHFHRSCCLFIILFVMLNVQFNLFSDISMFLSLYLKAVVLWRSIALLSWKVKEEDSGVRLGMKLIHCLFKLTWFVWTQWFNLLQAVRNKFVWQHVNIRLIKCKKKKKNKENLPPHPLVLFKFSLLKVLFYCWTYATFPAAVSDGCRYE